jgi:hypothetical protein
LTEISLLQQRAWALETEIERRKETEKALLRALEDGRQHQEQLSKSERVESFLTAIVESAADASSAKRWRAL